MGSDTVVPNIVKYMDHSHCGSIVLGYAPFIVWHIGFTTVPTKPSSDQN